MAKRSRARRRRSTMRFYVINIKLRSNTRSGESAYIELFQQIYRSRIYVKVHGDNALIMRTQYREPLPEDATLIVGKITRFTYIDNSDWLNMDNGELESFELDKNLFPNTKETQYFFFPREHRLVLEFNQSIGVGGVVDFLKEALLRVIDSSSEMIEVNEEQTSDIFDTIVSADKIKKLIIKISYTNQDLTRDFEQFLDEDMRRSNTGSLTLEAKPDHNGTINTKDSEVLSGAIKLAQQNGSVQATIIPAGERKSKRIDTTKHPYVDSVEENHEGRVFIPLWEKIKDLYRRMANDE